MVVLGSRIIAVVAALLWMSAPILACLPNGAMTPEEMACCQKMAGNCDMGGGNHKCCDTSVNHAPPSAALAQTSAAHHPSLPEVAAYTPVEPIAALLGSQFDADSIEPASSPPRTPSVLKN